MPQSNGSAKAKRICIVGAGSTGISSARQMMDEGFDPVLYERSDTLGGLWAYHNDDEDGRASVMRSTIINTSKEMSAYSDFPPPKELANFMHNTKMYDYFRSYADHFNVTPHVRLRHEVLETTPAADYDSTGRWNVVVKDLASDKVIRETFDAVMICIGHHVFPNVPTFKGQEKFKGKIMHTHSLKVPDQFKDRRVAVVGIGNSGVDAAVEASQVASQVYLSTRRGAWIHFRVGTRGRPFDADLVTRLSNYVRKLVPESVSNDYIEAKLQKNFNHDVYSLRPKHRYNAQHPTVNDALPNKIISGSVIVKKDIKEFTEEGILFQEDDEVTPLDYVILATGYQIRFPFLPKDVLSVVDNQVQVYKYVFPPNMKHPTLAIMGLVQPVGAIFPIAEMQARWMAQLLAGNRKLPSQATMYDDIARKRESLRKRYVDSPRHTIQVDYIDYMDDLADQIGAKPKMLKYLLTDLELFRVLLGPCVPYQYRLEGPHRWSGAREAILGSEARSVYPLNRSFTQFQKTRSYPVLYLMLTAFVMLIAYLLSSTRLH